MWKFFLGSSKQREQTGKKGSMIERMDSTCTTVRPHIRSGIKRQYGDFL